MPSIVIVKVSCVAEVEAENSDESAGSAGRYMSVANGTIADIIPKKAIKRTRLFFVICMKTLLSYAFLMKMQYCRKVPAVLRETRRMQFSA